MTEKTTAVEEETVDASQEITEEGRYIPYGGGSMGWFENSGVLKTEQGNNYTLHTAMASDTVRERQFERWGQSFNRRTDSRRYRKNIGVKLTLGKTTVEGSTRDISSHGVRVQFLEEVDVEKGQKGKMQLLEGESGPVLVDLAVRVVWCERIGKIRPVWNVGMTFLNLTNKQSDILKPFLTEEAGTG